MEKIRCGWVNMKNPLYIKYHDEEWGVPVHDDIKHFEMLVLEGAQAGLSWETILNRRENYRIAFDGFDPQKVSEYGEDKYNELLNNPGIIRNKLKIKSAIQNAKIFTQIQREFGSFDSYIWGFVNGEPIVNKYELLSEIPPKTELSDKISKDLKKRGMSFVGSTIIYAHLQAIGIVNNHICSCYRAKANEND